MKTLPDTAAQTPASGADTSPTGRLAAPVAHWWAVSRRTLGRTLAATLPALALLAALVLLWQWYASQPTVDPQILPTPLAVWNVLVSQRDILWQHTLVTL